MIKAAHSLKFWYVFYISFEKSYQIEHEVTVLNMLQSLFQIEIFNFHFLRNIY